MGKLRKILRTLIVFFIMANNVYATTDILLKDEFDIKKTVTLGAGIFLVVQILFISYQKDKNPQELSIRRKKRAEKIKEKTAIVTEVDKNQEEDAKVFTEKDLNKLQKEDENLFIAMKIEKEIETLPSDKIKDEIPKKRTLRKKEPEVKTKKEKTAIIEDENQIIKNKKMKDLQNTKKKVTIILGENKKQATKLEGEAKKKATKIEGEKRKKTAKVTEEIKRRDTKPRAEEIKRRDKKPRAEEVKKSHTKSKKTTDKK